MRIIMARAMVHPGEVPIARGQWRPLRRLWREHDRYDVLALRVTSGSTRAYSRFHDAKSPFGTVAPAPCSSMCTPTGDGGGAALHPAAQGADTSSARR